MPLTVQTDTIAAPATPPGRGGIGIIRVSGPLALSIFQKITHKKEIFPRKALHCSFYDHLNEAMDMGLVLFFNQPHSFTGEDVIEFQGHGGPVVMDYLLSQILHYGARLAKPGEFSERAFLNDKIDLAQAEAIADLIDSASTQAAKSALRSLQGEFSKRIADMVNRLIHLRIYVEAAIDFPDEEVDFLTDGVVNQQLSDLIIALSAILNTAIQGARLREGLTIVIVGKPNAGKSSLLNQLSGRESAIVTDIAGTTRDLVKEQILLDGVPLHIIDTAGLRESLDPIEQEGIRRARAEMEKADLILLLVDATMVDKPLSEEKTAALIASYGLEGRELTLILNKIDLLPAGTLQSDYEGLIPHYCLSAKSGEGMTALRQHLVEKTGIQSHQEGQFIARRRHLDVLERVLNLLKEAKCQFDSAPMGELLAEDLRYAQHYLQEITGEFTADDLLGKIFSSFCIGK